MSVVKTSVTINATLTSVKWRATSVVRTSLTTNAAWHLGVFVPSRLSGTQLEEGWVGGQKIYSRTHHKRSCTSKWWSRWKVNNKNKKPSNFNGSWHYISTYSKTSTACLSAGFKFPLLYCTLLWSISERGLVRKTTLVSFILLCVIHCHQRISLLMPVVKKCLVYGQH